MPSFLLRETGISCISPALRFYKREPIDVRKLSTELLKPKDKERSWLKTWWLPLATLLVALIATPWLIGPACPRKIVIATGSRTGAYFAFAQQYREILARDGIELEIRNTAGSIENTQLLMTKDSGISLAIIQGGTATEKSMPELRSLASLYKEPIWVFYRGDKTIERLTDLRGKQIAVGAEGSGTRAVALDLLQENHIATAGGTNSATKCVSLNTEPAPGIGAVARQGGQRNPQARQHSAGAGRISVGQTCRVSHERGRRPVLQIGAVDVVSVSAVLGGRSHQSNETVPIAFVHAAVAVAEDGTAALPLADPIANLPLVSRAARSRSEAPPAGRNGKSGRGHRRAEDTRKRTRRSLGAALLHGRVLQPAAAHGVCPRTPAATAT